MISAKTEEFADLKINEFKANTGWFQGFKDSNDVTFQTVCGQSASVDQEETNVWFNRLSLLIATYDEQNIFNVDETGLFFKCMPNKTFAFKG